MAGKFFNITRRFIFLINIICVLPFLITCLIPFLSAKNWWILGYLGLAFPFILGVIILFLIFWLFVKPLYSLINILILLVGLQQIIAFFAFNKNEVFKLNKNPNDIRILTWNVQYLEGNATNGKERLENREAVLAYLASQYADIICLQEYANHNIADTLQTNEQAILQKTTLNYSYFPTRDSNSKKSFSTGSIIFSRYAIIDSGFINYPNSRDKLLFVDIAKGIDTFRLFTTHLFSFKFGHKEYEAIQTLKEQKENTIDASKTLYYKLKAGFQGRAIQAEIVHNATQISPYPTIICGDFNDVPNSFTYFCIKENKQDAFLKQGFGIGRTFRSISPTLRIDYILADTICSIKQCQVGDVKLSDHYPVIADILINKK